MNLQVVVGGQYGSEAKGAVCGRLHLDAPGAIGVRVGGSQAGHTVIDNQGRRWALRHVPVAAVVDPTSELLIAEGSEVDPEVLLDEIERLEDAGFKVRNRLLVSSQATLIESRHQEAESGIGTGSTKKGVGAARADRIMRRATLMGDTKVDGVEIADTEGRLNRLLGEGVPVIIEGVQGFGLGLHSGFYPHVTSSNCRAIDFCAMAGLSTKEAGAAKVWVTLRPYPIRIAGNSGPLRDETTWEQMNLAPEKTTVTQKVRRVGRWDAELARRAVQANGGSPTVKIALMQGDYVYKDLIGQDGVAHRALIPEGTGWLEWVTAVEHELGAEVGMVGTGPGTQLRLFQGEGVGVC